MITCGYDNLINLIEITEEKVAKIENFVNQNRYIIEDLTCCSSEIYKSQNEFQFLLGHKATIIAIPEQIAKMKENRENKKQKQKTNKKPKSEDELKRKLIHILSLYPERAGIKLPDSTISDKNIIDFKSESQNDVNVLKCNFSCPFCGKIIAVMHKVHWMTSNATKHLKLHIEEEKNKSNGASYKETYIEVADK